MLSATLSPHNITRQQGSIGIILGVGVFALALVALISALVIGMMAKDESSEGAVAAESTEAAVALSATASTTPPAHVDPPPAASGQATVVPGEQSAGDDLGEEAGEEAVPSPIVPATTAPPSLPEAKTYVASNNIIDIDISEYAGYAGLIVANGGLEPNPNSFFAKEYGLQLRLKMSEEEGWYGLNSGKFAASATTVDVLPVLGRQFSAQVPVLLSFSRGSTMIITDKDIKSVNHLKNKVIAASQFNEADFFPRYLAQEAGIPVEILTELGQQPTAGSIGIIYYEDAFSACDAYAAELASAKPRLQGAVGWTPRTDEVVSASKGKARILTSNRNLLIVADVLCFNRGFAEANPEQVQAIVHGIIHGNNLLRTAADQHLPVVAKAFAWSIEDTKGELALVHLANLPENLAFFNETIDAAGSFGSIYHASSQAYGSMIGSQVSADRFRAIASLEALDKAGKGAGQQIAIAPIRSNNRLAIEGEVLLSKDIRFFFQPNSAELEQGSKANEQFLDDIRRFLQVSPGSMVLLKGHVDNANVAKFRQEGGEELVKSMGLKAVELSQQRSNAVRSALLSRHPSIDSDRIEAIGRGWEEPAGEESDLNRRVEAQWFTLE